jgi:hypothetical protein
MTARVTATEVKAILDASELTDATVDSFIFGANALVNSVFGDTDVTDLTKEIERWFTAHLIATTVERMAEREGVGGASITYTGKYGMNLSSSPYGQMVLTLDTSNLMAGLGNRNASVFAVPSFDE